MKSLLYILSAAAVMGLAVWAYQQNNDTRQTIQDVSRLQNEIGALRETLAILNAEWAYLNRPERLSELADLNFDRLGLLPLRPEQFGYARDIPFTSDIPLTDPVELSAIMEGQE